MTRKTDEFLHVNLIVYGVLEKNKMADDEQVPEEEIVEEEEEDLVDPQDVLKERCSETKHCNALREILDECNERVESKSNTAEVCVPELFEFVHCVDHCVAKNLFQKLK